MRPFPYLLLPSLWAWRNRTRVREHGDLLRAVLFGGVGVCVYAALLFGSMWLTRQVGRYEEPGDFLLRLGRKDESRELLKKLLERTEPTLAERQSLESRLKLLRRVPGKPS